jgi:hypothetical protein
LPSSKGDRLLTIQKTILKYKFTPCLRSSFFLLVLLGHKHSNRQSWLFSALPSASPIVLPLFPVTTGTSIFQSFSPAGVVDAEPKRLADDFLPNLPPPLTELATDDPEFVRDLLQPLPDRVGHPP